MIVKLTRITPPRGEPLPLPRYMTDQAAGVDLHADIGFEIPSMGRLLVPTGLAFEIPPGYEGQVRPRSGLAIRHGISIPNAPGTIDSDYRGELKVALINLSDHPFRAERGERIAQLVIAPVSRAEWVEVEALGDTERGDGGFGSTGR